MDKIHITATNISPEIILNSEKDSYSIIGKSTVSKVDEFYKPVLDWIENLDTQQLENIEFIFDLEYFNIFSSKRILFILYRLSELQDKGVRVKIVWRFSIDDEDMKEIGEDFACMVNIEFEFISKTIVTHMAV